MVNLNFNWRVSFAKTFKTLIIFSMVIYSIGAFAQKQKNVGTVNQLRTYLKPVTGKGLKTSNLRTLETPDGPITVEITSSKSVNGLDIVMGRLEGQKFTNFEFIFNNNTLVKGEIIIASQMKAYTYSSDAAGNASIQETDIHKLICIENPPAQDGGLHTLGTGAPTTMALPPPSDPVYKLESLPGVPYVVLLDFDGQDVTGTKWETFYGYTYLDPTTFSASEITTIWKSIVEDYSPFVLNVTTNEAVFNAAPAGQRVRTVFTATSNPDANGITYTGSFQFPAGSEQPALVFNALTGGVKQQSETGAHETGHAFDLFHNGTSTDNYYYGHGNWRPIMGSGYDKAVVQFCIGEYYDADDNQDQLSFIKNRAGGYRTDEAGSTNGTATALALTTNGVVLTTNKGIITTRTDIDVYSFTTSGGTVNLNVDVDQVSPNLDVLLKLYNSSGTLLSTVDPQGPMNASISTNLAAGTYYLWIDGTGYLNPLNTGYSDYGSLGQYFISGTVPVTTPAGAPIVSITTPVNNASFPEVANISIAASASDPGGSITKVEFYNGSTLLSTLTTAPYTYNWTNVSLGTYTITALAYDNSGNIAASTVNVNVTYGCTVQATPLLQDFSSAYFPPTGWYLNNPDAKTTWERLNTDASQGYAARMNNFNYTPAGNKDELVSPMVDLTGASSASLIFKFAQKISTAKDTLRVFVTSNCDGTGGTQVFNKYGSALQTMTGFSPSTSSDWRVESIDLSAFLGQKVRVIFQNISKSGQPVYVDDINIVSPPASNQLPVVSITSPSNGATYTAPASVSITATASDPDGTITKVEFYNGTFYLGTKTSAPYSYTMTGVAAGSYNLIAKAYDNSGGVKTSATVTITVSGSSACTATAAWNSATQYFTGDMVLYSGRQYKASGPTLNNTPNTNPFFWTDLGVCGGSNQAPTVSITSPSNGATFTAPASVAITANASDPDGIVTKVDFFNGPTLLGTVTTAPYTYTWINVPNGTYSLTAKAYDYTGISSTSSAVSITVNTGTGTTPTITYTNVTKTYGNAPFAMTATSNSSGAMTYSITSGSSFASINATTGQVTILGAGIVTVQVSQAASGSYTATTKTATLTINKAALTATANNQSRVYNTANPTFTIAYTGFVNGETASVITAPTASTTATTTSNVGTYPITLTGGTAANYTITLVNGTLTVTQATPTLAYTGPSSGTVGAVLALTSTTTSSAAPTFSVTNGPGTATLSGSNLTLTGAGTVTVTVAVAATTNYSAASINVPITINPLTTPTITYNGATKIYGDAPFAMTATSNSPGAMTYGITAGSSFASINATTGQVTILGAGTVTVQVAQAASGSFAAATKTATLNISKASLTARADDKSRVYNTANPSFTISYTGFVNSENASVITAPSASTTATLTSNAGTYPITLTGGTAANYSITLVNGTLTVTKATPTLTYTGPNAGTEGAILALTATTNSTATPTYSVANGTGTATLSGSNLTLNTAGTVTVSISIAATINYTTATVNQTITINRLPDPTVSITFGTSGVVGDIIPLGVTTNSTGTVTYIVTNETGSASLTGTQLALTGTGTVTVSISITSDGTYAGVTVTQIINISAVTANIDAMDSGMKIYPSITESLTTIEIKNLNLGNGIISITNMQGVEITNINYHGESEIKLEVSDWTAGVYVIKLQTEKGERIAKFIKQ